MKDFDNNHYQVLLDYLDLIFQYHQTIQDFFEQIIVHSDLSGLDFATLGDLKNLQKDAAEDPSARLSPVPINVEMIEGFREHLASIEGMQKAYV